MTPIEKLIIAHKKVCRELAIQKLLNLQLKEVIHELRKSKQDKQNPTKTST